MEDLNNFHGYFPGGFYRQTKPIDYQEIDPSKKVIIGHIDRLIAETDFDVSRYMRICQIIIRSVNNASTYFGKEKDKAKHHAQRMGKFQNIRNEMIYPIYEKMRSLGYDHSKLAQ